ncbi:MAG: hypothetical protein HYV60_20365 [Planctomycetia bacterium]|nr:hypothetical protein [Planctomycetia bacterium]
MTVQKLFCCGIVAALAAITATPTLVLAEKRTKELPVAEEIRAVGLFEAMDKGDVAVRFIPKDATEANVLIENKTDKPLTIKFPEAFAGVPVLAQFGGGGGGFGGGGGDPGGGLGGGGGGGGQGLGGGGGGLGGGGGGFGGGGGGFGGGGGGFFNVAPQKVTKVKVPCVCLEHGKPDPTPRMNYKIVPIDTLTKDPNVIEVCKMLGYGEIPQNAAQAAAWNLANGLSWQELAVKNRVELKTVGYAERFFAPLELVLASRIADEATRRAKATKSAVASPGEQPYSTGGLQTGGQ